MICYEHISLLDNATRARKRICPTLELSVAEVAMSPPESLPLPM